MKRKTSIIKVRIKNIKNKIKILIKSLKEKEKLKRLMCYVKRKKERFLYKYKNADNKILFILKTLLESRMIILLLLVILMIKSWFFYYNIQLEKYISYTSILFIMLLIIPMFFIKKDKNRFALFMIYLILTSVLLFVDNVYWEYASNMLSVSQIFYVKYAEEIGAELPYLLQIKHILYFIDIPIFFMLWHAIRKKLSNKKTKYIKNKGKRRLALASIYTVIVLSIAIAPIKLTNDEIKDMPYLKIAQVENSSIYGYHILDIYNSLNIAETTRYKTYNEVMDAYSSIEKSNDKSEFYGTCKGKNVIVLQLESIQNFVVNRFINGTEITPNLNKFLKENIEFTNMMVQSYSTTADSEYSVLTSLYPLDNGQAFSMYSSNINNDIFKLYKDAGYNTSYMHGNIKEFWNRNDVYKRLKVDQKVFLDGFEDKSELIGEYLSDELFYKQVVEKLAESQEPFFTYLVAASSHTPFELEGIKDKYSKVSVDVRRI